MNLNQLQNDFDKEWSRNFDDIKQKLITEENNNEDTAKIITKHYFDSMKDMTEEISKDLFENLERDMGNILKEERSEKKVFEKGLDNIWKDAFNYLESLIISAEEISSAYLEETNTTDDVFEEIDFLLKIHARSILIAKEILQLLKSGYVDGAMARWRSLHEANVIFHVLSNTYRTDRTKFQTLKQRFLDYSIIDKHKRHVTNWKNEDSIKEKKLIDKQRNAILKIHGQKFGEIYGWAFPLVHKNQAKITFNQLERLADYQNVNPYYKEANHHVHVSSVGINESLSFMSFYDNSDILLYGPSNYGLSKPGQLTSISIAQITTKLLMLKPNLDKSIHAKTLEMFARKCISTFDKIQASMIDEELNRYE